MQVQDLIWQFRIPELGDFREYVCSLPTNTLMGMGAFAAITTYWYATRPRALKPPCDLTMQSVEVEVQLLQHYTWNSDVFLKCLSRHVLFAT